MAGIHRCQPQKRLLDCNNDLILRRPVMGEMGAEPEFVIGVVLQREFVIEVCDISFIVCITKHAAPLVDLILISVSIEELMFTDNDELSGLIALMVGAEMLVLLTGVDGLYNGDPMDAGSEVIRKVKLGDDVSRYILSSKSAVGRGGMTSKFNTAISVAQAGTRVLIACGNRDNILPDLIERPSETIHTEFVPS